MKAKAIKSAPVALLDKKLVGVRVSAFLEKRGIDPKTLIHGEGLTSIKKIAEGKQTPSWPTLVHLAYQLDMRVRDLVAELVADVEGVPAQDVAGIRVIPKHSALYGHLSAVLEKGTPDQITTARTVLEGLTSDRKKNKDGTAGP